MKNSNKFFRLKEILSPMLGLLGCLWLVSAGQVQAQQFDDSYLKWKNQQLDHDRRLLQQTGSMTISSGQAAQISTEKVSLNRGTADQLQQALSGVGEKKAQAIVEYRNKNGKFNSIEDLQKVKGIGPKLFEKNKSRLTL
ncbi:helix-hairpin-helix domain-containing protein [Acinetobacter radioresistens]|uniref:ComEA family DNA-binding protein n=1 Tax=Acinetobacter TaxID=469 RepID=UPI00044CBCD9|nr:MULTISPECIES: ComEA family DNA-binding protein [Acinetobacter]EXC33572.1 competence ComEA helix-hairpin-helix repeat region domain protein [Acinetobacter sp. 869535]EXE15855.1 competence ComEA helix-hairpin-helix repeat region domain protein [Acinetobacter sp. 983759]MCU4595704.1 helix-hairpin-helix domain-containing protein [Acinetobacter radioresistens]QCS11462.1 helix-hairpin-helix domain-containing protein [Acinetobacter radioresistens]